jgi:hypothetical protein
MNKGVCRIVANIYALCFAVCVRIQTGDTGCHSYFSACLDCNRCRWGGRFCAPGMISLVLPHGTIASVSNKKDYEHSECITGACLRICDDSKCPNFLPEVHIFHRRIYSPVSLCLLRCDSVQSGRSFPMFRSYVPLPSSGLKNEPSMEPTRSKFSHSYLASCLLAFFFKTQRS